MPGFSADWLSLRERYDAAARARSLEDRLDASLGARKGLTIVDLGCGTGSNLRHLAPRLGSNQSWRLVDYNETLLSAARRAIASWAESQGYELGETESSLELRRGEQTIRVAFEIRDLSTSLPSFDDCDLVTASALFDLVSQAWVEELAACMAKAQAYGLFVLTYDGRAEWRPPLAADPEIIGLFNRHQQTDKGFGPALGPEGALRALAVFAGHGFATAEASSDWQFSPDDAAVQQALLASWVTAARELAPEKSMPIEGWLTQRCDLIVSGLSQCVIGHKDLLVLPRAA